jgi:hypothetical protein
MSKRPHDRKGKGHGIYTVALADARIFIGGAELPRPDWSAMRSEDIIAELREFIESLPDAPVDVASPHRAPAVAPVE